LHSSVNRPRVPNCMPSDVIVIRRLSSFLDVDETLFRRTVFFAKTFVYAGIMPDMNVAADFYARYDIREVLGKLVSSKNASPGKCKHLF